MKTRSGKDQRKRELVPTGINEIDRLARLSECTIQDYVEGVSAYVRQSSQLASGPKKAGQIRLSHALARALALDLGLRLPQIKKRIVTEEKKVSGALRTVNADVSETHELDGLRLAIEIKPINLAVGRAIWNRFGDIRTFAVNLHLKFPFSVVGGVLVIPIYEHGKTNTNDNSHADSSGAGTNSFDDEEEIENARIGTEKKSTIHLIRRAIERLIRAGGRRTEADASHLLEGIAVVVYDPDTATLLPDLPAPGTGLRWDEFVDALATAYQARFED